ncbi:MAG: TRAP transporter substrate-binding protein, partial [Dehalococcoidia bacterium]|nr:TRAP transporter substrate-binding protein [Dehalococcoidia bacterium]
MKNKILLLCMALALIASLVLLGCSAPAPAPKPSPSPTPTPTATPSPAPAPVEKINLRFSAQWPEPSPIFKVIFKPILEEIEQKSKGRITFTVFGASLLGGAADQYDLVRTGKADMGTTSTGYTPGRFPLSDVLTFPGAYETSEAGQQVSQAVADRMLNKEFPDTKLLSLWQTQTFYLYTANKQIRKLEDMKGVKIRSAGGIVTPALEAVGATPVHMPLPDSYLALQTGVVEGAIFGPSAGPTYKLHEVLKHALKFKWGYQVNLLNVNPDTWAKIPDDLKPIMVEASRKAGFNEATLPATDDPIMTKSLLDRGGSSYTLPPDEEARWINAIKPVINKWVSDQEAKGQPVQEL